MKPIIEARALARQQGGQGGILLSPNSDEATPATRTDTAVADLANLGKDTIRKIAHIEQAAAPEIKALAAAGDVSINLAGQFTDLPVETQQEAIAAECLIPDSCPLV